MTVLDILEKYNLTRRDLSNRFNIPYSTVQKWCLPEEAADHREASDYVVCMMNELLEYDNGGINK